MGYSRAVSNNTEAQFGKYYDLIAELPPRKTLALAFHSNKQLLQTRYKIYNWMNVNHYQGAYRLEISADGLTLSITNQALVGTSPSQDEIRSYLASLPTEGLFETTLAFVEAFRLLPPAETNNLRYRDRSKSESDRDKPESEPPRSEPDQPDIW